MICAVVAFERSIHGRCFGLNTAFRPAAQIPECMHFSGCHSTVTSPFVYSRSSWLMSSEVVADGRGHAVDVGHVGVARLRIDGRLVRLARQDELGLAGDVD